jgi:hypothetical protein
MGYNLSLFIYLLRTTWRLSPKGCGRYLSAERMMFPFPLAYILQAIDWTYIFYGLNYQLVAVLQLHLGGIYTKHSTQTYAGCFLGPSL